MADGVLGRRLPDSWRARARRAVHLAAGIALLACSAVALGADAGSSATGDYRCRGAIATLVGTAGDDRLRGTSHDDVIVARAGNDVVYGLAGDDRVCDNDGTDHVLLGPGDDEAGGGRGSDHLEGGSGKDWLAGRRGNDVIEGDAGNDRIVGELGNDNLRGEGGNDNLGGGPGTDDCRGGPGRDRVRTCERGEPRSDRPAVASDDTDSTSEMTPKNVPVLSNDSDPDDDPLSVASLDTTGTTGNVSITGGGSGVLYDPAGRFSSLAPGESATDTFRYTLAGGSGFATVIITVSGVDTDPTAVGDTRAGITEDASAQVIDALANDTDPDGGAPKSIASVTQPPDGTVAITGGGAGLNYTPDPDYCTTSLGGTDNFTYALAPGGSSTTVAVTVDCVNDAPVSATTGSALAYTEGDGASPVDSGFVADDVDSGSLSGATVAITAGHVDAEDELAFVDQNGISGVYDQPTGTLTLSGTSSLENYQAALRSVTYQNSSDTPSANRTVSFQMTDSSADTGNVATRDIAVTATNDAPTVATSAGNTSYTENGAATIVDGAVTVADIDDIPNIEGATVRISSGFQGGDDELLFTDQNGITGTYDSGFGVLTLDGTASKSDYQTALRSITFRSSHDDPPSSKTVEFKVNDGDVDSGAATKGIAVTPVNDAPTLGTTSAPLPYAEDAPPIAVDAGLTATDPDSAQLKGATVAITSGFHSGEDELAFGAPQNGISGTYNSGTGVLTLTGNSSVANYQAALRVVTYANSSNNPSTDTRTLTFQATDAQDAPSNSPTRNITVGPSNDAPIVATSANATPFTEGDPSAAVDGALTVTDADDTDIESAQVRISSGFQSGDALEFTDTADIDGDYVAGTGILTLTGSDTVADYQAALRSIEFNTTNDNPATAKTVEFKVNDGDVDSNLATKNLAITGVNDAPTLTATVADLGYEEGDGPVPVDDGLTVADPDSTEIQGATVSITSGFVEADDELAFANQSGITGSYEPTTGVLTLSGTTSLANYQTALRSVTYENTSDTTSTRTVSFQATDAGGAPSNVATRDISIGPVNDAPVVTTSAGNTAYTEDDGATAIDGALTVADEDDANIESAQVRISANFQSGDLLEFADTATITGIYTPGTGILALTGSDTVANYQAALRSVTFRTTNENPSASKTVEFKANDGDLDSNAATKGIAITALNNPPDITAGGTLGYTENDAATQVDDALTVTEPESNNITEASASVTTNFQSGEDALDWADNNLADNIELDSGTSTAQTVNLTGADTAANYQAALRAVTYVNSSDDPDTSTRTVTFSATDDGLPTAATGTDTSTISVTAVDDPPVAVNDSATVLEDASATSVDVLTNDTDVDSGPKTISSASDPANGTVVLTGGSAGEHTGLTYQPDPEYCNDPPGTTPDTFTYTLNGGSTATVSMTVTCVNDAPVADDETFNGTSRAIGNTSFIMDDPSDGAPSDPAGPQKTVTGDILAGDTDIDGPGPLVVEAETKATTDGGSVTIEADGDFTYTPPQGCTGGADDSFDYTVKDSHPTDEQSGQGTVTIAIADCVWYVDDSATAGGDGRSHLPYDSLADLDGASGVGDEDGTGHYIFLYDGSYTGGLPLENSQRLFTEKHGLSVPDGGAGNVALEPADGSGSDLQGGLVLANGNSVQGLDLGTTGSSSVFALSGTSVGTANVNNLTAGDLDNPDGGAVNIDGTGNTLNVVFGTLTSTGSSTNAIRLVNSSGTFSGTSGTLSAATGTNVTINGGGVSFTLGSAIADDAGQLVLIQNKTGGTNDFNGAVTDAPFDSDGGGISLQSSTGTTRFDGGVKLSTGPNPGIVATNGGTLAVPDPDGAGALTNFIDSTTNAPLNLAFTSIASDDLVFERLSSNGATTGILLNTTGSAGGLIVTGDAVPTANSGGTIQSSVGPGISLNSVGGGVDLTRVRVMNGGNDGIRATDVTGLNLANSTVSGNGNAVGERGLDYDNVKGTSSINDSTVTGSGEENARIDTDNGTLNLTVDTSTFSSNSSTVGADGLLLFGDGTATIRSLIADSTFSANRDDGFNLLANADSNVDLTFTGNTVHAAGNPGAAPAHAGVTLASNTTSDVKIDFTDSTIDGADGSALIINPIGTTSTFDLTVDGITIGTSGVAGSGSATGQGIRAIPAQNTDAEIVIKNSSINGTGQNGMLLRHNDGGGTSDFTVTNNVIRNVASGNEPIFVQSGSLNTDTTTVCADIGGSTAALENDFAGQSAGGVTDIAFRRPAAAAGAHLTLPGFDGNMANLTAYIQNRNVGSPTVANFSGALEAGPAACQQPAAPVLP